MFSDCRIRVDRDLEAIVARLMKDRDFAELRDNKVSIGIFIYEDEKPSNFGGRLLIATELEKMLGYDVAIYMNDSWVNYHRPIDVEAYVYQLMLSITPKIVGAMNTCVIFIDRDHEVVMTEATVKRYGREIKWYKSIYEAKQRSKNDNQG